MVKVKNTTRRLIPATAALARLSSAATTDFNAIDWNRASNLLFDESVFPNTFDLDATTYSILDTSVNA